MGQSIAVAVGGVTAKIYRSDTGGYASWLVRYFVGGKAKSLRATTLKEARSKAKDALKAVASGAAHVDALTPKETATVSAAVAKLRQVGVPLMEAVSDYVAARRVLPAEWTVADAARGFAAQKAKEAKEREGPEPTKFRDAVAKFHERNERRGLSEGYKGDCRKHLKALGKTLDDAIIQTIRQPELTACLEATTSGGARRFNNLRATLNALFGFCQKEGILPRDRTHEAALVEKKEERDSESIAVYTPGEMRAILAGIGEELLPWAVLGGFAGLRVSEIHRMRWENIRLDAGVIALDKSFTKTKRRRVVPICPALRAWIKLIRGAKPKPGPLYDMPYKTYEDRIHKGWAKMAAGAGGSVDKRANALRHSYGTYRFAVLQDEFRVSAEMGNSPGELRASYAELALPGDAKAWFSIFPKDVGRAKGQVTRRMVESYSYDIFGAPTVRDGGGNVIASSAYGNRTMFTGREWIKEVGLYDYRNRVYSAALGRFVQTDPIRFEAGDVNLYRYVQNNPVNYLDGLGLAVVKNNSGSSLTVSGNIGSGHGTSSSQSYGVVPDGATGGGNANPVRGYPTPEEAEYASDPRNYGPHRPTGTICDIDSYGSENDPSGSDGFLPHRVIGDEQGPTVTVTKDSEGSYQESETGTLGAYIRRGLEKLGY